MTYGLPLLIMLSDTTEHISSTIPDTTRHTDGTTTVDQETTGTTADLGTTTGSGTTTSLGTTPSRTTPYVTSSGTPSWTTTQHVHHTTQVDRETTHYRSPSTPEVDHELEENELDHEHEEHEHEEHDHGHTQVQYTDLPVPESEPETPFYPHVPSPPFNPSQRPGKNKNNGRITSETEERAAMIIGIVAGACIAVILVIFLLVWLRKTGDRTYKNDRIVYGQGPNAALLGSHSNTGTNGSRHQATNGSNVQPQFNNNGSMRNGSTDKGPMPGLVPQKPKKRDSKDIKEWYV